MAAFNAGKSERKARIPVGNGRPFQIHSLIRGSGHMDLFASEEGLHAIRRVRDDLAIYLDRHLLRSPVGVCSEDVTQDTFRKWVWKCAVGDYCFSDDKNVEEEESSLRDWMWKAANFKILENYRAAIHAPHICDFPEQLVDQTPADASLRAEIESLLTVLTARERRVVEGVYLEGRGTWELASELDTSEANVRVILCRALKRLRRQFPPQLDE